MTAAGPAPPVVSARGVAKGYGATPVLEHVDADIGHGVTGLLGTNGSGKTTLIGLVLGLHHRDAGELTVLGHDPEAGAVELRQRIGYSPEHHLLPPDVAAMDLVRHLAQLHGIPRRTATERASDALWQVGLGEERFRPIGTMSTGQRQRVKLAAAFAHDPDLVFLDEPTDGLDPVQRDEMLALIRRIGTEFGIDVVLSSHLLDEVERVCDGVLILAGGRAAQVEDLGRVGSGSGRLVVELDGPLEGVAHALTLAGLVVRTDGTRLLVEAGDTPVAIHDAVRDAVADAGVGLRRLEVERRSLADLFEELG